MPSPSLVDPRLDPSYRLFHVGFTTYLCREDPSAVADREAEPPGFWTERIEVRNKFDEKVFGID
jgi:hypothetical protein